ncbi:hypothetical protein [Mycolicibacterium palauense]|uniref:hypothetical protein n=1 Tax=Mycolicibacterium palauense TaxID=2034511 RepID=UPI00159BC524|nr:hypothetical protein [Mycolicibacterium palauense]
MRDTGVQRLAVVSSTGAHHYRDRRDASLSLKLVEPIISRTIGRTVCVDMCRMEEHGWADTVTLGCFGVAAVMLTAFVLWQPRTTYPMLPLRLFAVRSRSGSYATMLCIGAGMFATFYFLTLYIQQILGTARSRRNTPTGYRRGSSPHPAWRSERPACCGSACWSPARPTGAI